MIKKNLRILALALAFVMLFVTVAGAAIPQDSVVIGNKAYSIAYVTNAANQAEIQQALDNLKGGQLLYQINGQTNGLYGIMSGQPVTQTVIANLPAITYKDATGQVTNYAAGNGDPVQSTVGISSIAATNGTITPTFAAAAPAGLALADFTVSATLGGAAYTLKNLAFANNALIFTSVAATSAEQTLVIKVAAAAGNTKISGNANATVSIPASVLGVSSVSAINGKVTVAFDKAATEVPAGLSVLKDGVDMALAAGAFAVVGGKVEATVPTVTATAVEQSIVYSVKLGAASAVAASALVVAADPILAAQAAAKTAVAAYEAATLSNFNDIATTSTLKTAANTAVAAVTDAAAKTAFTGRITAKQTAITTQLTGVVAAVNAAGVNQAQLLASLKAFFVDVVDANLAAYDVLLNGTQTLVAQIQSAVWATNDTLLVNTSTNQVQLLAALKTGVGHGTFTNVRDTLVVQYATPIIGFNLTTAGIQVAITAANGVADAAATAAVTAATAAVIAAEAGPTAALIAAAQTLVTALPADVAPVTTKASLNARLAAVAPVAPVLAAKALSDTMLLNAALQASVFTQVNPALMADYLAAIVSADVTVALIQARINAANTAASTAAAAAAVAAATAAVGTAEAAPLTAAKVATAQPLVTVLPADVAPATTKAALQTRLDVVNALLAVDAAVLAGDATDASVLAVLQANATVLAITDLNAPYASFYRPAFAGAQTVRDTAAEVRAIITTVNAARLVAATADVVAAEAAPLTAAKVATAQALVIALPADVAPSTTKAALQTRLDVVNTLLTVDGAVIAAGATDASVLAALQANATVLGITNLNAPYASFYRPAFVGAQTVRDTVAEVRAIITAVNAARLVAATADVVTAEAAPLTAAKVATTQALVTALPADVAPAATKAALQTRLSVVNALLSVDGAVIAAGATDASVVAALQANATVLGLTGASAVNPLLATPYRAAIAAGAQATRDTAAEVQALIAGVNSPAAALAALGVASADADVLLAKLKAITLNLSGVKDANKAAYFADVAVIQAANGSVAAAQAIVDAINALVELNAATTAANANNSLTTFTLNVTHASSTTYINLNSTVKLEVAELVLVNKPGAGYANIVAVQAAITAQDAARTAFLGAVNAAASNAAMMAALNVPQLPAFQALAAAQKLAKAELVLNASLALKAQTPAASFTTITAVKSAAGL